MTLTTPMQKTIERDGEDQLMMLMQGFVRGVILMLTWPVWLLGCVVERLVLKRGPKQCWAQADALKPREAHVRSLSLGLRLQRCEVRVWPVLDAPWRAKRV